MRVRHYFLFILTSSLLIPLAIARPPEHEDGRLEAKFKAFLDEEFRQRPTYATSLGDHRFDDRLDDVSPKARAGWARHYREALQALETEIDPKKLSRSGQIDLEIFKHYLRLLRAHENTKPFDEDPRSYNELLTDSVYILLTQSSLPQSTNVRNAVARMAYIPRVIAAAKESLKTPVDVYLKTAINQNRGAIAFYESGVFEAAGETGLISELKPAARRVVEELKEYQRFLESKLGETKANWRIGKQKFAEKLLLETDAGLTAEQVYKEAETEFERVEREMYVISRQLWSAAYPGKTLPPDDAAGRSATIHQVLAHYNRDHGEAKNLVHDARATVERIKEIITKHDILRLPEPDRCKVIEMPEFQRGFSVAYLNPAPPLDPKTASHYAISPPPRSWDDRRVQTYLEEYNKYMLQILTIHEAYPGHYVQLEYSNRHPSVIRKILSSGIFAEGWAVYTEQMMLDQGYGNGDLPLRLNQLKFYLRAVGNAILDHKMHCTDMSDEEALEFLTKRVYQSEAEAVGKITVREAQLMPTLNVFRR